VNPRNLLFQTCKVLHTLTATHTFWLLLRRKLETHCKVLPLNLQDIAIDELRRGIASAWMLHDEWPLKNARWRTIPAFEVESFIGVEDFLENYTSWVILFDDGVHILHSERDMTFKIRVLHTGEVLQSLPMGGDCRYLEHLEIDGGAIIVQTGNHPTDTASL
jgi:hypothetical protein